MTIMELGALGEFLAAFAVLVTLIYLATQVSQTKRIVKLQASQNLNEMFNHSVSLIATSPTLAALMHQVEVGEEITPQEWTQLRALFQTQFNAWENSYTHANEGVGYRSDDLTQTLVEYFNIPGAASAWEYHRPFASSEFEQYVSKLRSRNQPD